MPKHYFSRRTFLQGLGVTMALPWLESLNVWGDEPRSNTPASEAPVRLAVLFCGNGFHSKEWWARGEGAAMEFGRVLTPLHDFREKMLFVRGLYHEEAGKGNIHSSQTGNMLSGAPIAPGGEIRSGTSFDQVLAQTYGRSTKVPSLVLACERSNPLVHKNYSMLYSSHISWSSPTTPTPLELFPALAFDRLFKDETTPGDQSVLDAVLADAQDLRRNISRSDQQKLDEYLDSVRAVERRIENAGQRGELQGWRPTLEKPNIQRPADGIPQDIGEHMRLMCDILVLGFQTDTTRITTLKLNSDHSVLRFPNLPSVQQSGHGIDFLHIFDARDEQQRLAHFGRASDGFLNRQKACNGTNVKWLAASGNFRASDDRCTNGRDKHGECRQLKIKPAHDGTDGTTSDGTGFRSVSGDGLDREFVVVR